MRGLLPFTALRGLNDANEVAQPLSAADATTHCLGGSDHPASKPQVSSAHDHDADADGNFDAIDEANGDKRYYPLQDFLYSTHAVVDSSGTVLERYDYAPYGAVTFWSADYSDTDDETQVHLDFLFTGQMLDPETGLYHYKSRALRPAPGRFSQRDPIDYAGAANLYEYVGTVPHWLLDPRGEQGQDPLEAHIKKLEDKHAHLKEVFPKPRPLPRPKPAPVVSGWAAGGTVSGLLQGGPWTIGTGVVAMFFSETCEVALYTLVTEQLVDGQWREFGEQASVAAGLEKAWHVGGGRADAQSFNGVFYTVEASAALGLAVYVGEKNDKRGYWVGGTVTAAEGAGAGLVRWRYTLEDSLDLDDYGADGKCACLLLKANLGGAMDPVISRVLNN